MSEGAQEAVTRNRRQTIGEGAELGEQIKDALGHWPAESAVAAKLGACVEGNKQRVRID